MIFEEPWLGRTEPDSNSSPNTVAGSRFISTVVAECRIIFSTSIEGFDNNDNTIGFLYRAVRQIFATD